MPHIQSRQGQVKRGGQKSRHDILVEAPESLARDDLGSAFAGDHNRGPAGKVSGRSHGTHEKSRRLRRGQGKRPVR